MTDQELHTLLDTSPQEGYRAMFEQYFRYVYSIVFHTLRSCGKPEDVEECVIDTFAEVMPRLREIQTGFLKAYLGTTARNKALNSARLLTDDRDRRVPEETAYAVPSVQHVEEDTEAREQSRILLECIRKLGEPDSTIILHKFYYDHSSGDIARITGLSPAAVRKRCSRAMKKLRKMLEVMEIDW